MTVSGSWFFNEMAGKIPEGFDVGTMNFPVFSDGGRPLDDPDGKRLLLRLQYRRPRARAPHGRLPQVPHLAREGRGVRPRDRRAGGGARRARSAYSAADARDGGADRRRRDSFNMPQTMLQPPGSAGAGRRDAAPHGGPGRARGVRPAARGRGRGRPRAVADPDHVDYRHPVAGAALLAGWRPRGVALRGGLGPSWAAAAGGRAGRGGGGFGRLRAGMAAWLVGPAPPLRRAHARARAGVAFVWAFTRWDGIGPRTGRASTTSSRCCSRATPSGRPSATTST
jgi:hypothetical protein